MVLPRCLRNNSGGSPQPKGGKGQPKGKSGPPKGGAGKKGQNPVGQTTEAQGLLGALTRLVNRAHQNPETLLERLKALVDAASHGKYMEPLRTKKPQKPEKGKGGKSIATNTKGKSGSKTSLSKQGKSSEQSGAQSWAHIVRGKKVAGNFHGPVLRLRNEDWVDFTVVPHVNQFGPIVDQVGKGKPFVLLVNSQEQLDEVEAFLSGDAQIKASVFSILGFGKTVELDPGSALKVSETKVPLVDGDGKVTTRKVQCWSNHKFDGPSKARIVVPADKRPPIISRVTPKQDTLVIRLTIDQRFTNPKIWAKARQNPGVVARNWMKEAAPVCGQFLQDTWGWELMPGAAGNDTVIKGLVRVKRKDQLTHLLSASGKSIQDIRVFLDPLDWTLTPKPWGKKPHISWVERRNKEDEAAYMNRAAKLGINCGLARGWRQIGVRSLSDKVVPQPTPVRTWILKSAPRYWTLEQVQEFLEASQFQSLDFVSKKWEKFGTSWIFKGKREGPAYLQLLYSGDQFDSEAGKFLVVERLQPTAWQQSSRTKLRDEKRVSLRFGNLQEQAECIPVPSEPSTPVNAGNGEGQGNADAMDETERSKRGEMTGDRESPAKKRAKPQPLPAGVLKVTNDGGGDCLFHSIGQSIEHVDGKAYHHRQVRAAALAHLKRHADKYSKFWDHRNPDGIQVEVTNLHDQFQNYLQLVSQVGAWAGNLEIAALASTLDRPIFVIHQTGQIYGFNTEGSQRDLWLYYSKSSGHYESLQVPAEVALSLRTKALLAKPEGGRQDNRGGGKSSSLGGQTRKAPSLGGCTRISKGSLGGKTVSSNSGPALSLGGKTNRTRKTWVKQAVARLKSSPVAGSSKDTKARSWSSGTRRQVGKSLGGKTLQTPKAHWFKQPKVNVKAHLQDGQPTNPFLVGKRAPKQTWTCLLCKMVFHADDGKLTLAQKRSNHIANRHPGERSKVGTIREYMEVVEASASIPLAERDWVCPFCPKALPSLPKTVKEASVTHHYKSAHPRRKITPGRVTTIRWKLAKNDPDKVINYRPGKLNVSKALRKRAMDRLNPKINKHNVVQVLAVNWTTWPRSGKSQSRKGDTLTTCTKCRNLCRGTFRWGQTTCRGKVQKVQAAQRAVWKRIADDNRQALCEAWNISMEEAQEWMASKTIAPSKQYSGWVRDLTQEGVEPNPGPRGVGRGGFQVINCNVQSAKGAWSMVDYPWSDKAVVITMQEIRMSDNEMSAFTRHALKKGFRVYHMPGQPMIDRWGVERPNGGVAMLIDKRLNYRGWVGRAGRSAQVLGIWIDDWFVGTFYGPPPAEGSGFDPAIELCELLNDIHIQTNCLSSGCWMLGGDANATPAESPLAAVLSAYGGQVFSQGSPTRWEGSNEIDWFIGNNVAKVTNYPQLLDIHVSDHIPILVELQSGDLVPTGSLRVGPSWTRPIQIDRDEWRELIEKSWNEMDIQIDQLFSENIDVEQDWIIFNQLLDSLFRHIFMHLQNWTHKPEVASEARRRLKQKGIKGVEVSHKTRVKARCRQYTGPGSMRVIKLRKRVARLYELQRQMTQALQENPDIALAGNFTVCQSLIRRLRLHDKTCTLPLIQQELVLAKDNLNREETAFRQEQLQGWKQKFLGNMKFASRWVKGRQTVSAVHITNDEGISGNEVEALEKIRNFWQTFWQQARDQAPPTEDIIPVLLQHTVAVPLNERPPSPVEFSAIATDMQGCAGVDGWSGEDLNCFPIKVWEVFSMLVARWLQVAQLPEILLQCRTVFLVKPNKIQQGTINAADCRPITICSAWWRLLSSTWIHMDHVQSWMKEVLHTDVCYGPGCDAQVAAGRLLQEYTKQGFLASLDYEKCYDLLRPRASAAILQRAGFPQAMTQLCQTMWSEAKRWLQWGQHVSDSPLTTLDMALPQGDPMGPFLCGLWLSSGIRWIVQQIPRVPVQMMVFIDDRSFCARSAPALLSWIEQWQTWSNLVGLRESTGKIQVVAKTAKQRRELYQASGGRYNQVDATFLGVTTRGKPRRNSDKERGRFGSALGIINLLGTLKLPYAVFTRYARSFGISRVAYGWLARMPTITDCKKLWTCVKKGQKTGRMANTWLRAMIFGGAQHLDILAGTNLFRVVYRLVQKQLVSWQSKAGCPVYCLRKWFKDHRWEEHGEWSWTHEASSLRIDMRARNFDLDQAKHVIRQGWRLWAWDKFLQMDRHEIHGLSQCSIQTLLRVDFDMIRKIAEGNPAARAVATCATVSPAWFHARPHIRDSCCLWCQCLGHWHHLCWECPNSPLLSIRPAVPSCALERRLGWTSGDDTTLLYLSKVQQALWDATYGGL